MDVDPVVVCLHTGREVQEQHARKSELPVKLYVTCNNDITSFLVHQKKQHTGKSLVWEKTSSGGFVQICATVRPKLIEEYK